VRVDDPIADGVTITNEATAAAAEGVTATTPEVDHTVDVHPGVTIGPPASDDVEAPGQGVYPHTVTNTGDVTDTYGLVASSTQGWDVTLYRDTDRNGGWDPTTETQVIATTGRLQPGASMHLIAVVNLPEGAAPDTRDVATISATSRADALVTAEVQDVTTVVSPRLVLVKNSNPSGDQVNAGMQVQYALGVRNAGTAAAVDVVLTDDTPFGTTYVVDSTQVAGAPVPDGTDGDGNPLSTANGGHLLGTIPAGATVTVVFDVVVSPGATLDSDVTNTATVTGFATPSTTASRTHTVTSGPVLHATISAVPAPRGPVTVDDVITYTATIDNVGATSATGLRFSDDTPLDTAYVAGSATVNGVAIADATGVDPNPFSSVYGGYALGTLSVRDRPVELTFAVRVTDPVADGDVITNVATVSSDQLATATTPAVEHDVDAGPAVSLTPDGQEAAVAAAVLRFPHVVTNVGDVTDAYT
ncbi:MAG: DUF11 domain-containing protein, partial [Actinobacteria bacterium]|nr:DUF11 domain-containing protein [Actinomycetota bacterium]